MLNLLQTLRGRRSICADFANEEEARRELCFILNRDIADSYYDI